MKKSKNKVIYSQAEERISPYSELTVQTTLMDAPEYRTRRPKSRRPSASGDSPPAKKNKPLKPVRLHSQNIIKKPERETSHSAGSLTSGEILEMMAGIPCHVTV